MKTDNLMIRGAMAALLIMLATTVSAGTFNVVPFTSDATSGVSPANVYTHAIDFLGAGGSVNGVPFAAAPSQTGSNYALINVTNPLGDASFNVGFNALVPPGDTFHQMFNNFFYSNGGTEQVVLQGLTPGVSYSTRFYSTPWTAGGAARNQLVQSGGDSFSFNEDSNQAQYLDYTFTAVDPWRVIKFSPTDPVVATMHQYALTNQVAAVAPPQTFVQPIPGLWNTGLGANGAPLPNTAAAVDTHYTITANPDVAAGADGLTHVHDQTVFPIVAGPWLANTPTSKWIAPRFDTTNSAGGDFTYTTTFSLAGLNPSTARITGGWATDDGGVSIKLNGQVIPNPASAGFAGFTGFQIPVGSPFQAGVNTLEFTLSNGGQWTGLHVNNMEGTALSATTPMVSIPTIYNTGVDSSHITQAPGTLDPHYQIVAAADPNFSPPAPAVVQSNHPAWLANTPASSWISTISDGAANVAPGQYIFETSFDLTGFNPNAVTILGQFAADNSVDQVFLNGNLVPGMSGGGFSFWTPFTINSGFVNGANSLVFLFTNAPPGDNPGGFRLEMNGFAAVPEPGSIVLCALGFAGLAAVYRRRRRGA